MVAKFTKSTQSRFVYVDARLLTTVIESPYSSTYGVTVGSLTPVGLSNVETARQVDPAKPPISIDLGGILEPCGLGTVNETDHSLKSFAWLLDPNMAAWASWRNDAMALAGPKPIGGITKFGHMWALAKATNQLDTDARIAAFKLAYDRRDLAPDQWPGGSPFDQHIDQSDLVDILALGSWRIVGGNSELAMHVFNISEGAKK